ncbi:unnamed protein product [Brassica oleracea var. botrytis]|uniref:Uncharacterized protein n=1 Tax=Brassica oleracea TaxID=3712 RepID=A0A3P6DX89_BRAOL|nr:unnamed protein product [Brassica oleracea]
MLYFRARSIWVVWMRGRYLSSSPFWDLNEKNYAYSWMFRKLLKLISKALSFLRITIGKDPWAPFGTLYSFLGEHALSRINIPLFALVFDVRNGVSWCLPPVRLSAFLSSMPARDQADSPSWLIDGKVQKTFTSKRTPKDLTYLGNLGQT